MQRVRIQAGDADFSANICPIVEWTEDGPIATFSLALSMEDWSVIIEDVSFRQGMLTVRFAKRPQR